jgi:hypothetical protein
MVDVEANGLGIYGSKGHTSTGLLREALQRACCRGIYPTGISLAELMLVSILKSSIEI